MVGGTHVECARRVWCAWYLCIDCAPDYVCIDLRVQRTACSDACTDGRDRTVKLAAWCCAHAVGCVHALGFDVCDAHMCATLALHYPNVLEDELSCLMVATVCTVQSSA